MPEWLVCGVKSPSMIMCDCVGRVVREQHDAFAHECDI
jgi:hypothetical protein